MGVALRGKLALARTVGCSPRLRGGGATSAPGKVLLALRTAGDHHPRATARPGQRTDHCDEWKDDHGGDGGGGPRTSGHPARLQPRGRKHGRRHRDDAPLGSARRTGRSPASSGCSRSTSCGSARWRRSLSAQILLGNLFRDQLDRYGELEDCRRWAGHRDARRASCARPPDDPLIADLGREREEVLYLRSR